MVATFRLTPELVSFHPATGIDYRLTACTGRSDSPFSKSRASKLLTQRALTQKGKPHDDDGNKALPSWGLYLVGATKRYLSITLYRRFHNASLLWVYTIPLLAPFTVLDLALSEPLAMNT